jgi:dUTP pyrophosphatase
MAVTVKIVNRSTNEEPQYATAGASGLDVRAFLDAPRLLQPMERALIPTGLFVEIPEGYEIQVRPRSGLAVKQGITCLNTPGTIDADYRGEIKILLVNLSAEAQLIEGGERIAQLVLQKVECLQWEKATALSQTERSSGGFGSTGKE